MPDDFVRHARKDIQGSGYEIDSAWPDQGAHARLECLPLLLLTTGSRPSLARRTLSCSTDRTALCSDVTNKAWVELNISSCEVLKAWHKRRGVAKFSKRLAQVYGA